MSDKCKLFYLAEIWSKSPVAATLELLQYQQYWNFSAVFPSPHIIGLSINVRPLNWDISTFKHIQKYVSLTPCLAVNIVLTSKIWKSDERNPSWMNAHLFACLITCAKTLLKKQNVDQINVCCDRDVLHHKSMKIIFHSDGCYLNPNLVFCK